MIQGITIQDAINQYDKEGIVTIIREGKPITTDVECIECGKFSREEGGLNWCPREVNTICKHCCSQCDYHENGKCKWWGA